MPTYEYKCSACGHAFERFQPMSAAAITRCPECGKAKVKRLIGTGAGLIFKGSGFYITDYRSDGYKTAAKADSSGGGGSSKDSKSSDNPKPAVESKPAAESKPATAGKSVTKSDAKGPPKK